MSNYLNIPYALPFKFYKATSTPGMHFDDDWACNRIREFETKAVYRQKWLKSKTTPIQIESTVAPQDLFVLDENGKVVKNIEWTLVAGGTGYGIYECTVDFTDLPNGVYCLYLVAELLEVITWLAITEPIHVRDDWANLLMFTYKNSFNDFDVAWTTGVQMSFMVEAAIREFTPDRDRTSYVNQIRDVATLKAVPGRNYKLWIGDGPGVAEWVLDVLNRIWCCDSVDIRRPADAAELGKKYQSSEGSKWEVTRIKGWPLVGGTLEIVEARNEQSLQFAHTEPLPIGLVTAYDIETDFFGPGAIVPVTEVEQNS